MKPRPFDYVRPDTVEEVLALLAEYGDDARILAGGQSLVPMLNLRLIEAGVLIDISRDRRTRCHPRSRGKIEIGAAVTQNKLMAWPQLADKAAAARRGAAVRRPFPDPQQRHRVRLDRACRSEFGIAAGAGRARRRGGAALAKRGERMLAASDFQTGHADDRARSRRADHRRAVSGHGRAGRRLPRSGAASRRFRHGRGRGRGAGQKRRCGSASAAWPAGRWCARLPIDGVAAAVDAWADELEGYEDLHASAAMRRDLFRNLAPLAVVEAAGEPLMRRVNKNERVRDRAHAQRPQARRRGRAAHAAERFPAPWRSAPPAPMSAASTASAAPAPC